MMILKGINLTVSFLLELVAVFVFAVWGFNITDNGLLKIILGIGAPALMIVVWGVFMAPLSKRRLQDPGHLIVEIVIFGLSVLALFSLGRSDLALMLAIVVIVSIGLSFPLQQRPGQPAQV